MSRPNHLAGQTSPYLLQHLHNPVDWHPWGEEALALARERDLPIFLSVGYAACHWCHNLKSGSTWTIMWRTYETVTSVATIELGYKTEGTDWKLTRTFTGNPGSYDVKVPYVTSPQKGMVAVRLKDSSGNVLGTDTSDTFFTIQP